MEEQVPIWKNSLTYGLILGLALVVFELMLYVTDALFVSQMEYLIYIIIVSTIIMGSIKQKKLDDNSITYGKAFGTGAIISISGAIIFSFFVYILYKFIDSGLIEKFLYETENSLLKSGFSESDIELQMKMMGEMNAGFMAFGKAFGYSVVGVILSLITSIFIKTRNQNIA
jgi:hypothetical protein